MQAYLASRDGVATLATETGAGQWGAALAYAGSRFGLATRIFMVRSSFRQKPGRRVLMELFGGSVVESPGPTTAAGRSFFERDPDHPGSLGIAISEAVELAAGEPGVKYALGSVLDSVLMHQTVIGLEAEKQMAEMGAVPDTVIGCVGGGSNFAGLAFPFVRHNLAGRRTGALHRGRTRGLRLAHPGRAALRFRRQRRPDAAALHAYAGPGLRAAAAPRRRAALSRHGPARQPSRGAGRRRGAGGRREAAFDRAVLFMKTEGILPAPESAHAVAAAVDEALAAKKDGRPRTILFNLSGHGFLDIGAYAANGRLRTGLRDVLPRGAVLY